jgi:Protein of unknown function (DUF2933)
MAIVRVQADQAGTRHTAVRRARFEKGSWCAFLSHTSVRTQASLSVQDDHKKQRGAEVRRPSEEDTMNDQHISPSGGIGAFLRSPSGLVLLAFLAIGGFYLITEHTAHVFGLLPYALFLLCPILHLLMHGGHGGHGSHDNHAAHQVERTDGEQR